MKIEALAARQKPGFSLEKELYTSPEVLQADLGRVFRRHWLFAGHACQVPFSYRVGQDQLSFFRSGEGKILEAGGAGVREVEGLIFVCLSETPPDFAPFAEGLKAHLAPYDLPHAKVCLQLRYEVKANWKLLSENFRECYHCSGGHPEYCKVVFDPDPDYYSKTFPGLYEACLARWSAQGLATTQAAFEGERWHHFNRIPFRPGFNTESLDGKPVAPLMGGLKDPDAGVFYVVTYPNFYGLQASSSYVSSLRLTPLTALSSEVELTWLVRGDAVEGKDYDPQNVAAFWKATAEQDFVLVENNQAGVNSRAYQPGPYAQDESETQKFVAWYLGRLA